MSKSGIAIGASLQPDKFRFGAQLLDTPEILEFNAEETTSSVRKVTIAMLRGFQFGNVERVELLQSFRLLQMMNFRSFPRILEVDTTSAAPKTDIWIISNWKPEYSLSEVLGSAKKKNLKADTTFALYILKTLCSAVSLLHQCRVSEFKTIHGSLTPESIWIDEEGNVRSHNHVFGLAAAHQQNESLAETCDIRDLGKLYWYLITSERWSSVAEAARFNPSEETIQILEASGLWHGSGCSFAAELGDVVDQVIDAGAYYATQKYASHWQREARKRLPKATITPKAVGRLSTRPIASVPITPNASTSVLTPRRTAATYVERPAGTPTQSLAPWIVSIIVMLLAGGAGVLYFLSK